MTQTLVILLFGFPAVIVSLLVSVIGVWKEKYWLVIIGALLFIPFSYYLFGVSYGFFLPLFQIGSAVAVRAKRKIWAWVLLLPAFLISLWTMSNSLFVQIR